MCGRYRLSAAVEALIRRFGLLPEFIEIRIEPSFNVAPTESAPVLLGPPGERVLRVMRWGLLPPWSRMLRDGARAINARIEGVATTPSFREPLRRRRCLVPSDGWYEWGAEDPGPVLFASAPRTGTDAKIPWWIRRPDRGLVVFAGLWERWEGPDGPVESFAILTRPAASPVVEVHDRMPVILTGEALDRWTDPRADPEAVLRAAEPGPLERVRVAASVGNVRDKRDPSVIA